MNKPSSFKFLSLLPGLALAILLLTPPARSHVAGLSAPLTLTALALLAALMLIFRKRVALVWTAVAAAIAIIAGPLLSGATVATLPQTHQENHGHDHAHDHGHGQEHGHIESDQLAAPTPSQISKQVLKQRSGSTEQLAEVGVDQNTRFDFVVTFARDVSKTDIETFLNQVIRRVHTQGCVRNLPCIARLLRLFEIGPKRIQVIAFDVMPDISLAERAALTAAIRSHPLSPGVHFSMSAQQAGEDF
jgi:hypothetical protein